MSRRDELSERQWQALADLSSVAHEVGLARYDDEALTDGYLDSKCDELVALAKASVRAARKLKKRADVATAAAEKATDEAAADEQAEEQAESEAVTGG